MSQTLTDWIARPEFGEILLHLTVAVAASIWTTAAIGVLAGVGLYGAAALGTALTLGTLTVFGWLETKMPTLVYAHHTVRFRRDAPMPETELRALRVRDPGLEAATRLERPHFVPTDSGVLSYIAVTPAGFDPAATYRGALPFGGDDWTLGWTDYPLD